MRKSTFSPDPTPGVRNDSPWLQLEQISSVEMTSEDPEYPIENALRPNIDTGWRAADPGKQTIRLVFDEPQQIKRIWLHFVEHGSERAQEFVLRWQSTDGNWHEIVRQQWNFASGDSAQETEDYSVEVTAATALELTIVPDRSGGTARASLAQLRLA